MPPFIYYSNKLFSTRIEIINTSCLSSKEIIGLDAQCQTKGIESFTINWIFAFWNNVCGNQERMVDRPNLSSRSLREVRWKYQCNAFLYNRMRELSSWCSLKGVSIMDKRILILTVDGVFQSVYIFHNNWIIPSQIEIDSYMLICVLCNVASSNTYPEFVTITRCHMLKLLNTLKNIRIFP